MLRLLATKSMDFLLSCEDPELKLDPVQVPDPLEGQNIYSNHGRGIFLINQLMDEVRFRAKRHRNSHAQVTRCRF